MSERKIVRYEHNGMGDRTDPYQGHGTRVAGVIAGSLVNGSQNAADGVAKDAKIHMWDIQKSGGESYLFTQAIFFFFLNQYLLFLVSQEGILLPVQTNYSVPSVRMAREQRFRMRVGQLDTDHILPVVVSLMHP